MPKPGKTIPLIPLKRICLECGVKRISKKALEKMSVYLEEYASSIAKKAIAVAEHSGRKTVKGKDVVAIKSLIDRSDE